MTIERRGSGGWAQVASVGSDANGRFRLELGMPGRMLVLRARFAGFPNNRVSEPVTVRRRDLTIAAVGDINLDSASSPAVLSGPRYPWSAVRPVLRGADLAFGNLECAVSRRGSPVLSEFNLRGDPEALRVAHDYAGMDVLNLANNHSGDYGPVALADTIRNVRRFGMTEIGAGRNLEQAARPRVVTRLGLRIAFVGFSDILPAPFFLGPDQPSIAPASEDAVRSGVRAARRRADLVIASFHWGEEGHTTPNAAQRSLAAAALDAGATAVIGGHPHVLQPVERSGRRVVAYSMGNFVFNPGGATGILHLRLSARGVEGARLQPAEIVDGRPTPSG